MGEELMTPRKGFTLLEVIIYILLFSFITLATSLWIARLWQFCVAKEKKQVSLITLYCAHDILSRDICNAPADKTKWKENNETCLIWHTQKGDIGWTQDDGQLVRIEGRYNKKQKKWTKKTKNKLATTKRVQFKVVGDTYIDYVEFTIADDITSVKNIVSPICRPLPWKKEKT